MNLDSVASCVVPNRDEVEIQFHETDSANRDDNTVIQITLHFPSHTKTATGDDDEEDPDGELERESMAETFQKQVVQTGVVPSLTGNIIVEFPKELGNFVTPRGKYALQLTASYIYMQGAQYAYKIAYTDISSYYLLNKPDGGRMSFVIALDKPIRQGNQKYQYLVLETHKADHTLTLNLSDEELQRDYDGQLTKQMKMPLSNLIAKIFKVLSQKSVSNSKAA